MQHQGILREMMISVMASIPSHLLGNTGAAGRQPFLHLPQTQLTYISTQKRNRI